MDQHVEPGAGSFFMADIRSKRPTRRRAVAVGEIEVGAVVFALIVERRLPKGDALAMAEMAGLQGTKLASLLMPLCHPLTLEMVRLRCRPVPERHAIRVYCEVATEARTGVEMEALAGVNAALLTLYDLSKPVEPALTIGAVRLLFKEGGKRGVLVLALERDDRDLGRVGDALAAAHGAAAAARERDLAHQRPGPVERGSCLRQLSSAGCRPAATCCSP